MKTKTFDVYMDPGHGWMKVKRTLIEELGVADMVSSYSYQRGDHVYLEEDCDMSLVTQALHVRGCEVSYRNHYADKRSRIRGYECYSKRVAATTS